MSDVVISVQNVAKKFSRRLRHVMMYGAADIARNMVGVGSRSETLRDGEFWAVDDVSFELKRGETLGIIGSNGSGKSTMLKMLNGIYMPDKGRIEIKGRVGALIEVGAGFHPMLTGRENVYINGAILGMSKAKIDRKFNDIVEFADIGDFIDSPVKHYSSGMFVRLGFAVAVHSEPDILLVDEVLAVGDQDFMIKSSNYILNMLKNTSVILVSHNLAHIRRLCGEVIVMEGSRAIFQGGPNEAVTHYMTSLQRAQSPVANISARGLEPVELRGVRAYPVSGSGEPLGRDDIRFGDDFVVELNVHMRAAISNPEFRISFNLPESNVLVASASTQRSTKVPESAEGSALVRFHFKNPVLFPRQYYLNAAVCDEQLGNYYLGLTDVLRLNIAFYENKRFADLEGGLGVTCLDKEVSFEAL